ncbi:MAG: DMT family transporter [Lachnospiraceae bacterium]|nr:DMT family transporter [Lachnospiraceae bacterium]
MKHNVKKLATCFAILAAALYAINVPLSKLLLEQVEPTMMASFLYLGAGIGLLLYGLGQKALGKGQKQEALTKNELPYTIAMVVLDIAAPIFLMLGIERTNSANVSLLNNFEIVATSLIALLIFKEKISRLLWIAIGLVVAASVILTFEGNGAFVFNTGSLFVLAASVCWGMENNCTNKISHKSAVEIVVIKGCFSGLGSLVVALILGEQLPGLKWMVLVLLLGFVAYGLSINFYIRAQNQLGAAKTSAFYSVAPFLGVAFSMALLGERPGLQFYVALLIMVVSTAMMIKDTLREEN